MTENYNHEDPFGWDEPDPQPIKLTRWQRIKYTILGYIFKIMFFGLEQAIQEREHRKKNYKKVIKQGWFGEYYEWHEK